MGKRLVSTIGVLSFFIYTAAAQEQVITIEDLFQLADQNSKSIQLHSLAIDETTQAVEVAKNAKLPSIRAQVDLNYIGDGCMTDRDFSNGIHADMPHFGNSFVLKASQTIYAGGSINANIQKAKLQQQLAQQTYQNNQQDLRFMLLGYYLDLFQLRNQQTVYEKNIEQTHLLVKDMRAAYQQGTALKSDITRYELQLQNLQLGLTSTINRLNVLNHKLTTTIGLDPSVHIVPDSTALFRINVDKQQETTWMEASQESPELQQAHTEIKLTHNQQNLIRSERRPHISLTATNEFNGPILIEVPPLNNNFNYWFAGVGISYNLDALFKSKKKLKQDATVIRQRLDALFKSKKKLKQARIATSKAEKNYQLIKEEIENKVHEAYVNLNEAYVRLHTQQKSVQLAHENFRIVRQRYLNGLSLITDMLDASKMQLDMELQLDNYEIGIVE